ncbi:MAG: molecular chaperone TorD family protein, partial [Coriobacteriales bacterium]|nr:molecular chaperone TorD family protein [Coriobacteriales bacterium]
MSENPDKTDVQVLIEVLEGRREFYYALAGFYMKPLTQEQIDNMALSDYSAFGADQPLLEAGFNDITRYLRKRNTGTRQMLAIDYTSSFGGAQVYQGKTAVPYASVYLSDEGLLSQKPRAEAFLTYKRNLLRVADQGIPDDHLSFMLEFLAVLSDRAAESLRKGLVLDTQENLQESRDFINQQILTWFHLFADQAMKLIETRFYRGVLRITEGYL